jgi:hypothetical protein
VIFAPWTNAQGESGGACATTAVVKGGHLYVAHVGDCRAVLSRNGAAAALTADHTCAREDERARIERQGGYVRCGGSGVWRVQGSLASINAELTESFLVANQQLLIHFLKQKAIGGGDWIGLPLDLYSHLQTRI